MSELNSHDQDRDFAEHHSQQDLSADLGSTDPNYLQYQINKLYRRNLRRRWLFIVGLWLTVGAYSLWELRYPIELMREDFTWAAVKYGIGFQPIPAFGFFFCVMMTISTVLRYLRWRFWGVPKSAQKLLAQKIKS